MSLGLTRHSKSRDSPGFSVNVASDVEMNENEDHRHWDSFEVVSLRKCNWVISGLGRSSLTAN